MARNYCLFIPQEPSRAEIIDGIMLEEGSIPELFCPHCDADLAQGKWRRTWAGYYAQEWHCPGCNRHIWTYDDGPWKGWEVPEEDM